MEVDFETGAEELDVQREWVEVPDFFASGLEPVLLKQDEGVFKPGEYTKGIKWSPDGWCCMVGSGDMKLRIFELPEDTRPDALWGGSSGQQAASEACGQILFTPGGFWGPPFLEVDVGDALYDFDWFPLMTTLEPSSYKFVVTTKNSPIHVRSAVDGRIAATYNCIDEVDEVKAATSVAFSPDGRSIYAGMKGEFRCFDVDRPGRDCFRKKLKRSKIEPDRFFRQTGIISCFAFQPFSSSVIAAGSYDKNIGIYSSPDLELWSVVVLPRGSGGVTDLKFSADGVRLFASSRKDDFIRCWDIRKLDEVYWTIERPAKTTQRYQLDVDPSGRYLASGSTDGVVRVWDVATDVGKPCSVVEWRAHVDCCPNVSFHPCMSLFATGSGQRHLKPLAPGEDDEGCGLDTKSCSSSPAFTGSRVEENSVKMWWCGDYAPAIDGEP